MENGTYTQISGNGGENPVWRKKKSAGPALPLSTDEIISRLSRSDREKLVAGYDMRALAKIFENAEILRTVGTFLDNGMNVSKTARILYMHRNTLIYKLNAIKRQTGLDLKDFDMALTFTILHSIYVTR